VLVAATPRPRGLWEVAALAGALVLVGLAWRANVDVRRLGFAQAAFDVVVGIGFLAAAAAAVGPRRQRLLVAGVGASWLLASVAPVAGVHRAFLLAMLLAFPRGRLEAAGLAAVVLAVPPMALGLLGLVGNAAAFTVVAVIRWPGGGPRDGRVHSWYPTAAALGLALVLGLAWTVEREQSAANDAVLLVYLAVLAAVAAWYPAASFSAERAARARLDGLVELMGSGDDRDPLARLSPLLAHAVGDPALDVRRVDPGDRITEDRQSGLVVIRDADQPVAVVTSGTLDDPATAEAVARVTRLILTADRVRAVQEQQLAALEAARDRLTEAEDRQRSEVAGRLRRSVLPPIRSAIARIDRILRTLPSAPDPALLVARTEMSTADGELLTLVEGVAPTDLDSGDLHKAIASLAERSPLPVRVRYEAPTSVDHPAALTLYYVCSEGLANVIKHAAATAVDLSLSDSSGRLELVIRDDGHGGAHPSGSGLQGMAERVAAVGGTMTMSSPPNGGTSLRVVLPLRGKAPPDQAGLSAPQPHDSGGGGPSRQPTSTAALEAAGAAGPTDQVAGDSVEPTSRRIAALLMTVALIGGTTAVLVSLILTRTERGVSSALLDPGLLGPLTLAWLAVSAGLAFAWWERLDAVRNALLLVGAGALLPFWSASPLLPPLAGATALAAAPLVAPGALGVATAWVPLHERQARTRGVLALTWTAIVVHLVGYDPFSDPSCLLTCDDITPVGHAILTTSQSVALSCALTVAAAAAAGIVLLRLNREAIHHAVLLSGFAALALVSASAVARVIAWPAAEARLPLTLLLASALASAYGALVGVGRMRARRRRLRHLVEQLGGLDPTGDDVAHAAQFRMPDTAGWVDSDGNQVPPDAISAREAGLVPLGPEVRLLVPADLVGGGVPQLGPADLLALSNARAVAITRAQQRLVRGAQARVVSRADAERRRIERDLHDGTQQRLVGAKLHLRIARSTVPAGLRLEMEDAEQDLQSAVEALREVSHGIFPRLLETEGLAPALAELAAGTPAKVQLRAPHGPIGVSRDIVFAIYRLVDAIVRSVQDGAGRVDVELAVDPDRLRLRASAEHPNRAVMESGLGDSVDRFGALGGHIDIEWDDARVRVAAELPCAS
jgi:signal transduction histidine kinase